MEEAKEGESRCYAHIHSQLRCSNFIYSFHISLKYCLYELYASFDFCGFGVFARPYIYGWKEGGYHKVIVANKMDDKASELYTICANSVLQGDYLAEDRKLPKVEVGDIIGFLQTGAYGATMMSLFPGLRKPGEILISKNTIKTIDKVEQI